jgi:PKD repeat protein
MRYIFLVTVLSLTSFSCRKEYSNGITFSPDNPREGRSVSFDCPSASNCYYNWDFGDGDTKQTTYSGASHSYTSDGSYYVTVNLDQNGVAVAGYYTTVIVGN